MQTQPIILITIYRRYHELLRNIEQILEYSKEFHVKPDIFIVWVNPEIGRSWVFHKLLKEKKIAHVISRLTDNTGNISFEESRNIRHGLEFIDKHYKDYFVVVQTADVAPKAKTYGYIQKQIDEGNDAVVFHLENGVVHFDIWHTNFFAVKNKSYWPPLSPPSDPDILEAQWGKYLVNQKLHNLAKSHNYQGKKFSHKHESEELPDIDFIPLEKDSSVNMYIKGYIPFWTRVAKVWKWLLRRFGVRI